MLRLAVPDKAPLRLLLSCDREVETDVLRLAVPDMASLRLLLMTVDAATLRLAVEEIAPLRLLLIWLSDVDTLTSKLENCVLTSVNVLSGPLSAVLKLVVSLKATEVSELKAVLIEVLSETACVEIAEETCALVSPPPPAALDWKVAGTPGPLPVRPRRNGNGGPR